MLNEIILFENQELKLEVNVKDDTVWLNTEQIAKLFDRDYKTIRKHINNALMEELKDEVVVAKFENTTEHGALSGKTQTHKVEYYNLDMILSVGYRVKSNKGIIFRKWANSVLKDYLLKGYAVNKKRLEYLEKTIKLIDIACRSDEENGVLKVINDYSKALDLLDDYDHRTLRKLKGNNSDIKINYDECMSIISQLKFNEKSNLFALERDFGLKGIINDIYQTFDNKDVYSSIEEKGANFLYMIVKNHVFIDGNKRIAATLFIYFLHFYNLLYKDNVKVIDNNTLTSLTLLIAQSNPKEKELIIDLVVNFLVN
ncbi:MAG: phosphoribosylaminoimidazolesuccinocarboxamide synthase [Firmicutes bacterium]|nr:phosphoribosylaminoimidazolesuccinocarboxamide synthase [Bacillota bacterium]